MTNEGRIIFLQQELRKTHRLLEYYRQFAPAIGDSGLLPPPGFFTHRASDDTWVAGQLVDGDLVILAQGLEEESAAIDMTWNHYKGLSS